MKQFKNTCIILIIAIILTACSNQETIFKTELVSGTPNKSLNFYPNLVFENVVDSAATLLDNEDLKNALRAEIENGGTIYKSDRFQVKLFLTTFFYDGANRFEFKLRTYSKDMKIIDSYIFSQTTQDPACAAILNGNLEITKTCDDGSTVLAHIDDYGKFIER